jgi:hypothetical protein
MASVKSLFRIPTLRNEPVDVAGQLCRADADGYITTDDGSGFTPAACAVLEQVAIVEQVRGPGFVPPVLSAEDVRIGTGDAPEAVEAAEAAPAVAAKPKAKPTKKHATKGGRR